MNIIYLVVMAIVLSSCGTIQRIGVGSMSGVLETASIELETESNFRMVEEGVPANLKQMEGLLMVDEDNETLLALLIKGYSAYGFAVSETLYLQDQLADREKSFHRDQAEAHYKKSLYYGMRFLEEQGVSYQDLLEAVRSREETYVEFLDDELSDSFEVVEAVYFIGQSWASLINLNRSNPFMVSQLSLAKGLIDWACGEEPGLHFGACDIFYGSYEAGRPALLGGNPEKGKQHFLDVIKKYPHNLLARVAYIQFYLYPQLNNKGYLKQKSHLLRAFKEWREDQDWKNKAQKKDRWEPRLNLYNTIAEERFQIFLKHERDIF